MVNENLYLQQYYNHLDDYITGIETILLFLLRFVFEKTFATCLTLDHLQGALTADNAYMELIQVRY